MERVFLCWLFISVCNQGTSSYHTFGPSIYKLTEPVGHGDGASWDKRSGHLYYADVYAGRLYSYNPDNGKNHYIELNGTLGPIVQTKCDPSKLIVGLDRSIVSINWNGFSSSYKQKKLGGDVRKLNTRYSAGKADRLGRLWFGTTGREIGNYIIPNEAHLYLLTKRNYKTPKIRLQNITMSNGLVWNRANNKLFYIDSPSLQILQFDYKESTAALTNRKILYSVIEQLGDIGMPSGMAIDKFDNLWVAIYGGGCVLQINSNTGKLVRRVALPAKYVTSVVWGGNNFGLLFVTSSNRRLSKEERNTEIAAGSLFAVGDLGVNGVPVYEADFC